MFWNRPKVCFKGANSKNPKIRKKIPTRDVTSGLTLMTSQPEVMSTNHYMQNMRTNVMSYMTQTCTWDINTFWDIAILVKWLAMTCVTLTFDIWPWLYRYWWGPTWCTSILNLVKLSQRVTEISNENFKILGFELKIFDLGRAPKPLELAKKCTRPFWCGTK